MASRDALFLPEPKNLQRACAHSSLGAQGKVSFCLPSQWARLSWAGPPFSMATQS